jgi:glycosyltransferase involved in cell wall biosynthesis
VFPLAKVLAAIPALNAEKSIPKVIIHTMNWVDKILVVDDGSQDDTSLIAEKLGATVIKHGRNLGKGAALRKCFDWARDSGFDVLVTLDADGQHNPDDIPRLLTPIIDGEADVVIASRLRDGVPALRRIGGQMLDRMVAGGGDVVDSQSGFRAYSRKAFEQVNASELGMGVDSEILMHAKEAGLRIVEVPVTMEYKNLQTSTHNPIYHWLDVTFSVVKFISIRHPLSFYGGFAAIMFATALVFGFETLDYYAKWGRVITNLALISIATGILAFLAFFTGVILFTLITVMRDERFR